MKTYFIDTNNGPKIIRRPESPSLKKVIAFISVIALVIATFAIISFATPEPRVKVHCTNADILVFQDMDDNYLAYVELASKEQIKAIKGISFVEVDSSVDDFTPCRTFVEHYEIRLGSTYTGPVANYGERVRISNTPAISGQFLTTAEVDELLANSSEETLLLYEELNKIFGIET